MSQSLLAAQFPPPQPVVKPYLVQSNVPWVVAALKSTRFRLTTPLPAYRFVVPQVRAAQEVPVRFVPEQTKPAPQSSLLKQSLPARGPVEQVLLPQPEVAVCSIGCDSDHSTVMSSRARP